MFPLHINKIKLQLMDTFSNDCIWLLKKKQWETEEIRKMIKTSSTVEQRDWLNWLTCLKFARFSISGEGPTQIWWTKILRNIKNNHCSFVFWHPFEFFSKIYTSFRHLTFWNVFRLFTTYRNLWYDCGRVLQFLKLFMSKKVLFPSVFHTIRLKYLSKV